MTTAYGSDELAWGEALIECRRALYRWARERKAGFYSELVPLVPAIEWPDGPHTHNGRQMGYLLGQVAMNELALDADRPLISALVIGKEENMPSKGFWSLLNELGVKVGPSPEQREMFWLAELQRCFDTYGMGGM